ncbi:transferrin-binding protein-like solute binding protein [Actinobacillus genomosp. 2]|uniref:transferrin-binding protein-like solute binding protein n=1 Tax=Actinobacillus genomosp. 2 TaxID=230709 RepID=UPI002441A96C|nr:transferrin-binding protein-like solute binding protein [Actinobacillus genomosp. 2]WGE32673.1 transferrin-binding protein-like solute binding protein [Actinobacillus genomosp. 2]
MNKNQFVKLSLTLVASAVLAACSSSSGSSNNDEQAKQQAQQQAQQQAKAAAEKAAAEKAAAEKAAAEKAAAEKAAAAEQAVKDGKSVGHKLVKKTESNFVLKAGQVETSSKSTGNAENMALDLHPSLDTVVVSIPVDHNGNVIPNAPVGYLEDFDFRGNTDNTKGEHTLQHIYKTANGSTTGKKTNGEEIGQKRGVVATTKTSSMGEEQGKALVYQADRQNYIGADEKVKVYNRTLDKNGVAKNGEGDDVAYTAESFRDRATTVAEVYGHRTFVDGNSVTSAEKGEVALANAPFGKATTNKDGSVTYTDVKLNHVQYGRVTSKLDKVQPEAVKVGKDVGATGTKVVSYGEYNQKGTENSYFYRGTNDTAYNANLTGDLAKAYFNADKAQGNLTYQGHAVTYGFEHTAPTAKVSNVPNALGTDQSIQLVSGTHAKANIDLATKSVTGNLYDVWSVDGKEVNQNIAAFNGSLNNAGVIAGTSTRLADKAEGSLNANLFGKNAEELGGALASKAVDANNSWGAAFGAKVQEVLYKAPEVVPPAPAKPVTPPPAWGVKTDEVDAQITK